MTLFDPPSECHTDSEEIGTLFLEIWNFPDLAPLQPLVCSNPSIFNQHFHKAVSENPRALGFHSMASVVPFERVRPALSNQVDAGRFIGLKAGIGLHGLAPCWCE